MQKEKETKSRKGVDSGRWDSNFEIREGNKPNQVYKELQR